MKDDGFEMKDLGLSNLMKAIDDMANGKARVGVLGDKTYRVIQEHVVNKKGVGKYREKLEKYGPYKFVKYDQNSNADIGAKHELGLDGMPVRSFLRMPLTTRFQQALSKANFSEQTIKNMLKNGKGGQIIAKLGIVGEAVVQEAFDTGGFGQWQESNMALKKNHQTLVETQQLRNSITSDVESNGS